MNPNHENPRPQQFKIIAGLRRVAAVLLIPFALGCTSTETGPEKTRPYLDLRYDLSVVQPQGTMPDALHVKMTVGNPGDDRDIDIYLPANFEKAGTGEGVPPLYAHFKIGKVTGGCPVRDRFPHPANTHIFPQQQTGRHSLHGETTL